MIGKFDPLRTDYFEKSCCLQSDWRPGVDFYFGPRCWKVFYYLAKIQKLEWPLDAPFDSSESFGLSGSVAEYFDSRSLSDGSKVLGVEVGLVSSLPGFQEVRANVPE